MPEMDGYEAMRAIREMRKLRVAADHRADRQGDEGRPREVHRGRRVRLHHQAGRHRAAALAAARLAVPVNGPRAAAADARRASRRSRSTCCSRRCSASTATTSATTRGRRCGGGSAQHRHGGGLATYRALQDRVLHDPGCLGAAAARALGQRQRDVPRSAASSWRSGGTRCRCCAPIRSSASGRPAARPARRSTRWRSCSQEEGLYDRCRIYATDINEAMLQPGARRASIPLELMQKYTQNYLQAGGQRSFSEYYTAALRVTLILRPSLREQHRLLAAQPGDATAPFNEFNVILCRNVMIYFNRALQERAHELFARQPGDVRHPRARLAGVDPVPAARAALRAARARREAVPADRVTAYGAASSSARRSAGSTPSSAVLAALPADFPCRSSSCSIAAPRRRTAAWSSFWQRAHAADRASRRRTRRRSSPDTSTSRRRTTTCWSRSAAIARAVDRRAGALGAAVDRRAVRDGRRRLRRGAHRRAADRRERRRRRRPRARSRRAAAAPSSRTRPRPSARRCRAAAIAATAVDYVLPLERIGDASR